MSITRAMYSGVSGLTAEGQALGVVGDNIANANTVGFKQSREIFEDVLGGAVSNGAAGAGVRFVRAQQLFSQGTMLNTAQPTDVALSGDGFLVVKGSLSGISGEYYTRSGQLKLQQDGRLTNQQGLDVQGYRFDSATGSYSAALGSIVLPTASLAPQSTSSMEVVANLDARATTPIAPFDPTDPATTSNYSTSMKVYDSLGNSHDVDIYFRKTASNTWDYHVLGSTADVTTPAATGTPTPAFVELGAGSMTFNTDGALTGTTQTTPAPTAGATSPTFDVTYAGATAQTINLKLGTPLSATSTGTDGLSQYGATSNVSTQSQNGYASGDLAGIRIDADGTVNGTYTNGQSLGVAKLAVAKFRSNDGLARAGQNLWGSTRDSGLAAIGSPGAGGRGAIVAGAVEQSNVDLAAQFVNLITHQRGFQANSKTITTADEMLQEVVNLKR